MTLPSFGPTSIQLRSTLVQLKSGFGQLRANFSRAYANFEPTLFQITSKAVFVVTMDHLRFLSSRFGPTSVQLRPGFWAAISARPPGEISVRTAEMCAGSLVSGC